MTAPFLDPPVTVPLRILGLNYMPNNKEVVRQAFRFKMFAAHPDLNPDAPPAEAQADVQELVWARDWLVRKIPDPVTPEEATRREIWRRNKEAWEKVKEANACPACKGAQKRPNGEPYQQQWRRGRWYRYCRHCAFEAERERLRDLRAQARAARPTQQCQNPRCANLYTPARVDGRFCSAACRQDAYRQRKAHL